MARRVPRPGFRTYSVTLEGVSSSLTEADIKSLIEGAVRDLGTISVAPPVTPTKLKTPKLRNRHLRKDKKWPCTFTMTVGGTKINGCGRTFASLKSANAHMNHVDGIWVNPRWPNFCLDAIVTPDLRDDR